MKSCDADCAVNAEGGSMHSVTCQRRLADPKFVLDGNCPGGGPHAWGPSIVAEHEVCAFCLLLRAARPTTKGTP